MQSSTEESQNGNGSCGSGSQPQPCACCAALAQLRMPWMDAAMQHAAPHYPYAQPYPYPYNPHQKPGVDNQRDSSDSHELDHGTGKGNGKAEEAKTLFFKLSNISKFKKDKNKNGNGSKSSTRNHSTAAKNSANSAAQNAGAKSDPINGDASAPADSLEGSSGDSSDDSANVDAEAAESNHSADTEWLPPKPKFRINFGVEGLAISIFGIFMPAFVLASTFLSAPKRITLVMLHHPVEAILEFLLVAGIPLVNYLVWSAICKKRVSLSNWLVMALGAGIGTGLVVSGISFAGLFSNPQDLADAIGTDFTMGFTWLGMLGLLAATVSAYLANRLRLSWELASSRSRVLIQTVTGLLLSVLSFVGAEYHPWSIRIAQFNALSKDAAVRKDGLAWLRQLNPEREMRMECSDPRAAGLAGLFYPIKTSQQHQLYFTLTGTPYSFRDEKATDLSSMTDDYLSRHVVGDKVPHLDLTRSSLNGVLHSNTLTSTLSWTFVVKNGNSSDQEMRAELGLPAGAAITGLTAWHKGEPESADFVPSGKVVAGSTQGNDTPAMVTDLGRGRVLVHCYPVPAEEELKVRVNMVVPLRSESDGKASLVTPQLIASNFGLEGEHSVRLRSQNPLSTAAKGFEIGSIPSGETTITGMLSNDQLENSPLLISAKRVQSGKPYAVIDKLAMKMRFEDARERERIRVEKERLKESQRAQEDKENLGQVVLMIDGSRGVKTQLEDLNKLISHKKDGQKAKVIKPRVITIEPEYVVEDISKVAAPAPKQLVVVVDGSNSMDKYKADLKKALLSLPKSIPTKVIIASDENKQNAKALPISDVLANFDKLAFVGGQDNLHAVVHGAELAGETKDAALLWIHGPQPVINREQYIISPYESVPSFYELPVVAGTDTYEFFKNHTEIGPFAQVPRNGNSLSDDLSDFFAKWNPNNNSYVATIDGSHNRPSDAFQPTRDEAKELITLHAVQQCKNLIETRHFRRAARIAVRYGFVSSVSSALVASNNKPVQDADGNTAINVDTNAESSSAEPAEGEQAANGSGNGQAAAANSSDGDSFDASQAAAPQLQGATNGTIGAQGGDATVIQGVNSAGTVRVNNLANLEALLNIIANLGELGALLSGICLIVHGCMNKAVMKLGEDVELGPAGRILIGVVLAISGLALPGIVNWFVASARDANLFS